MGKKLLYAATFILLFIIGFSSQFSWSVFNLRDMLTCYDAYKEGMSCYYFDPSVSSQSLFWYYLYSFSFVALPFILTPLLLSFIKSDYKKCGRLEFACYLLLAFGISAAVSSFLYFAMVLGCMFCPIVSRHGVPVYIQTFPSSYAPIFFVKEVLDYLAVISVPFVLFGLLGLAYVYLKARFSRRRTSK